MKAFESAENYLETILMLGKNGAPVRSVDIANALGYTKASVSVAMKNLRESGHIIVTSGVITLTKTGLNIAESIYERHVFISQWLISLGVDRETALADACKMEHTMSEQSFQAIKAHIESMHTS